MNELQELIKDYAPRQNVNRSKAELNVIKTQNYVQELIVNYHKAKYATPVTDRTDRIAVNGDFYLWVHSVSDKLGTICNPIELDNKEIHVMYKGYTIIFELEK